MDINIKKWKLIYRGIRNHICFLHMLIEIKITIKKKTIIFEFEYI